MNERLKYQGRLYEKELEAKSLKSLVEGMRDSIRDILDPFESVDDLDIERAFEMMSELASKMIEYKEITGEIKALKKALGR